MPCSIKKSKVINIKIGGYEMVEDYLNVKRYVRWEKVAVRG